jgi:NADH-quinone oxidoreductase subunit N
LNLQLFIPEIVLLVTAVLVILLDLFVGRQYRRYVLSGTALAGLVVAGIFAILMWNDNNPAIFNNMLAVDNFAVFFKVLLAGVAFLVILSSTDYAAKFEKFQGEYYALILFSTLGMFLMSAATDLISLYVALELASISLYILVGFLKDKKSSESALKYLLLGSVASAVLLFGMTFIFGATGQTQLTAVAQAMHTMPIPPAIMLGIALVIAGLGFKIAAVPFQMWVPDVYEGAPTTVTAFLSVASKAAGFAMIMRIFLTTFGSTVNISHDWGMIFAVLAAVSMTLGNVMAIPQNNIKRLLGYSSIAQAGYLMVGLAAAGMFSGAESSMPFGIMSAQKGVLFFLAAYALTNIGAFSAIIMISGKTDSDNISDYAGMGKRSPLLALALTLCLISLIGMPPAAGFMGKFYIFSAAASNGLLWLVIIAAVNSVISAYYYLRVVKVMWFSEPASAEKVTASALPKAALVICCLGVLALGIIPGLAMKLAEIAANMF